MSTGNCPPLLNCTVDFPGTRLFVINLQFLSLRISQVLFQESLISEGISLGKNRSQNLVAGSECPPFLGLTSRVGPFQKRSYVTGFKSLAACLVLYRRVPSRAFEGQVPLMCNELHKKLHLFGSAFVSQMPRVLVPAATLLLISLKLLTDECAAGELISSLSFWQWAFMVLSPAK